MGQCGLIWLCWYAECWTEILWPYVGRERKISYGLLSRGQSLG